MKKNIITIDTGTTNTRAILWQENKVVASAFEPVGVRNTAITGNNSDLKKAIKKCIDSVLDDANVFDHSEVSVLASGMLTSNIGLLEIQHVEAPAGIEKLAKNMVQKSIPEIFDESIWFIPGVKNQATEITPENITDMDVIRGEEVETIGLISEMNITRPTILFLPGSHTKIIKINENRQIIGSITSMTGELLSMLTKESILADSLNEDFADSLDSNSLLLGAKTANKYGFGRTAFTVRPLEMFTNYTRNQRANFLLGAVLENDIFALKKNTAFTITPTDHIVIAGKPSLSNALALLIKSDTELDNDVIVNNIPNIAGIGAIKVAEKRELSKK